MNQEELQHFGVLGMKWGVRRANSGYIKARATLSRRDRKEQQFLDDPSKVYNAVYKKAASGIRKGTRILNNSEKYRNQDFKKPSELRSKYYKDYSDMVTQQLNAAATSKKHPFTSKTIGMSPKRTLQMKLSFDYEKELRASYDIAKADTESGRKASLKEAKRDTKGGGPINQLVERIRHSDIQEDGEVIIDLDTDDMGYIQDMMELEQGELTEEDLMHFGRMGMKWGQRIFGSKQSTGPTGPKSEDHINTRQIKRKQVSEMSTQELQQLTQRLNLEKQYSQLNPKQVSAGKKIATKFVSKIGDSLVNAAADATSNKIKKEVSKYLSTRNPTPAT